MTRTALAAAALAAALLTGCAPGSGTGAQDGDVAPVAGAFTGTVDLDGCSGAVVRLPGVEDDDPALVLTAGHCFEGARPVPGEVLTDQPSHRLVSLLDGSGAPAGGVHAARALYVTMTGTDLALYRLEPTYAELERDHGVLALPVAGRRPEAGAEVQVVSASQAQVFDCTLGAPVHRLLETGYVVTDAVRYSPECDTRSGTSGSPVLSGGEVVAVNSTSNAENTDPALCVEGSPCEMDRQGVITARAGASYGTQTHWLVTCWDDGALDLERAGCLLPRPDPRQPSEEPRAAG